MYSFSIVVIENLYIQTNLMVRVREGGGLFISQRITDFQIVKNMFHICVSFCFNKLYVLGEVSSG